MPTPDVNAPDRGIKAWLSIFRFTAVLALIIGVLNIVAPAPRASALADVPACPASWANRALNTYFRHNGTAAPTPAGEEAWDYITQGFPTVIYSDNPTDEVPVLQIRIYNDSGTGGSVQMHPSGYSNPEYLIRLNNITGYISGGNLQVRDGVTVSWNSGTDETPPFGSFFGTATNWSTGLGNQNLFPETTSSCVLAIGGRISVPQGIEVPYATLNQLDEQAPVVDHGWNVVEWLKEFWGFITKLPQFFMSLFIPETSTITTITNDFGEFFSEKFGFLVWPFEYIADFLGVLTGIGISDRFDDFGNPYNWCTLPGNYTNGTVEFGNFMGGTMTMNGCAFQKIMPTLWTLLTIIARGLLIFALINFLLATHRRHVK